MLMMVLMIATAGTAAVIISYAIVRVLKEVETLIILLVTMSVMVVDALEVLIRAVAASGPKWHKCSSLPTSASTTKHLPQCLLISASEILYVTSI